MKIKQLRSIFHCLAGKDRLKWNFSWKVDGSLRRSSAKQVRN